MDYCDYCDECGAEIRGAEKTYPSDRGEVCRKCYNDRIREALRQFEQAIRRMKDK